MKSDLVKELKGLSDELKREADAAEDRRKRLAMAATEEVERRALEKADAAMSKIRDITMAAAKAGKREAVVYEHTGDEMGHDGVGMDSWPIGAAKLVKEACTELGFRTSWGSNPKALGGRKAPPYAVTIRW